MKHPLGMPEGSVRAIVTIAAVGSVIYQWVTQSPVPDEQQWLATLVVTYYFASRTAEAIGARDEGKVKLDVEEIDLLARAREARAIRQREDIAI